MDGEVESYRRVASDGIAVTEHISRRGCGSSICLSVAAIPCVAVALGNIVYAEALVVHRQGQIYHTVATRLRGRAPTIGAGCGVGSAVGLPCVGIASSLAQACNDGVGHRDVTRSYRRSAG